MATKQKTPGGWVIQFKAEDGKWRHKRCGKNATAADAEVIRKLYDGMELNRKFKTAVRITAVNLQEALTEFAKSEIESATKAKGTKRYYLSIVNCVKNYFDEKQLKKINEVTPEIIDKLFKSLSLTKKPSTVKSYRLTINQFFAWAIKKHYITANPAAEIKKPKKIEKLPRYFSEEELRLIFDNAEEPYTSLYKFLYFTGLRITEAINLRWGDYNASQKHIILRVQDGNKTKREAIVPLSVSATAIVESFDKTNEYVFVYDNKRHAYNTVHKKFQALLKKLKIPNACLHTFRHTCASHLVIKGVSLYVVKEILRHASITETERYAHLSKESIANAVELLT